MAKHTFSRLHETSWLASNRMYTPAIAPINTLYPDIPQTIFLTIAQDADWIYQSYIPQISHVCSHWRSLALDTPQLWNHFQVGSAQKYNHCWISECRRRARSAPLHVHICMDMSSYKPALISAAAIYQAIPDFRLIETLSISADIRLIQVILKGYRCLSDPNIRHLTISAFPYYGDHWVAGQRHPFTANNMPHLKALRLEGYDVDDWGSIASFHPLKVLHISTSHSTSLEVFSALPCLEELSVRFNHYEDSSPGGSPIINDEGCFQLLKTFTLSTPHSLPAVRILEFLSLPSCTSFSLSIACPGMDSLESTLVDLSLTLSRLVTSRMAISRLPVHRLSISPVAIEAIA
ncbi:hypothetical protein AX16_002461 [Volvariella volvacea WC 439]|nr:hypothetical protein AX16_002461 [Volvariella volvacea WC 439]